VDRSHTAVDRITSRHNRLVARIRAAARDAGELLLDGPHLVAAALAAGIQIEVAVVRSEADERTATGEVRALAATLVGRGVPVLSATPSVLEAMSPVRTPSGIVALAPRPTVRRDALVSPAPALIAVLAGVQDAGNVGAAVRAVDAAGGTGVITTAGCADPFGWKAVRGSMGSVLRVPVWAGGPMEEITCFLRGHDVRMVAADARASHSFYDTDWTGPVAILLGSEGGGLDARTLAIADASAAVPMKPGVESLNLAVTTALFAYEVRRARLGAGSPEVRDRS
jgi:TrmH family RNA methyltransferase